MKSIGQTAVIIMLPVFFIRCGCVKVQASPIKAGGIFNRNFRKRMFSVKGLQELKLLAHG